MLGKRVRMTRWWHTNRDLLRTREHGVERLAFETLAPSWFAAIWWLLTGVNPAAEPAEPGRPAGPRPQVRDGVMEQPRARMWLAVDDRALPAPAPVAP